MPRIRSIKPEFWTDEKIASIPHICRLLFIGTWNLADDYGILKGNSRLIKAQLFPYDDDVTAEIVDQFLALLIEKDILYKFSVDDEEFLIIRKFDRHQRIDKPSKHGHISPDKIAKYLGINNVPETFQEYISAIPGIFREGSGRAPGGLREGYPGERKGKERKGEERERKGKEGRERKLAADAALPAKEENQEEEQPGIHECKTKYQEIPRTKEAIHQFIKDHSPTFMQPFVDYWNIFADEKNLPQIVKISKSRERKFSVRIKEPAFQFTRIISMAAKSEFLLTGSWFGWDWIMENDSNYLKILEGNYTNRPSGHAPAASMPVNGQHSPSLKSIG